jgi:hypothetical protein
MDVLAVGRDLANRSGSIGGQHMERCEEDRRHGEEHGVQTRTVWLAPAWPISQSKKH